jgi:hypothetical protein
VHKVDLKRAFTFTTEIKNNSCNNIWKIRYQLSVFYRGPFWKYLEPIISYSTYIRIFISILFHN